MKRGNRFKDPAEWEDDVERSIADYNEWYLIKAPEMWAAARRRGSEECEEAMRTLGEFRTLTPAVLMVSPMAVAVVRMAISPTVAQERFAKFAGLSREFIKGMEEGKFPRRVPDLEERLERLCEFARPRLDRELLPWLTRGEKATPKERRDALLVLADRRAAALYLPVLRNSQEARQKALMQDFLEAHGFVKTDVPAFEMPPGTFRFGRNFSLPREGGGLLNMPCDGVVAPLGASMPLVCLEMKSAGDVTNVNKRRKEEAAKHAALSHAHGDTTAFVLQLFGYFDRLYLRYEAEEGIDWAWDHRLEDLAPHFGIEL